MVSSNSFGVMMFVSDATEAAQYALLHTHTEQAEQAEVCESQQRPDSKPDLSSAGSDGFQRYIIHEQSGVCFNQLDSRQL